MTANDFFEHFAALADAQGGIPKLRELILQSALQGKLVSQDASDEPASALLERITSEKKRLANGKVRKPHVMDDASASGPWPLTTSWAWTCLDEIGWLNPRNDIPDETEVSFIPMALIPAAYGKPASFEKRKWGEIKTGFTHFAEGDVVVAKITPCFQNGKSCVMRRLLNRAGAGTTELHVFRVVNETTEPDYVLLFLKSPLFLNNGVSQMTGSAGQKRVPGHYFASCPFPLPPLAEQKRIVAKVDRLMALCDALEAQQQARHAVRSRLHATLLGNLQTAANAADFARAWQRLRDHFAELFTPGEAALDAVAQLRQTILQLAVQGKLVPQDGAEHIDLDEIAAIEATRKTGKKGNAEERAVLIGHAEINGQASIPRNWEWIAMEDVCLLITDGTHLTPKYTETGRIFLSAQNVRPFQFLPDPCRYVSEEDYQGYIKSRKAQFEDVLLTRVGAGIGQAAVIDRQIDFAFYVSIGLLRPNRKLIIPAYLATWLNSPSGRNTSRTNTLGIGVSQGNLNLSLIRRFIVSIPPLAEQQRIVAKVQQLMAQCDALEASLKEAATVSERWSAAAVRQLLGAHA